MTVVAAFLVPGAPLLLLRPNVAHWGELAQGYARAAEALAAAKPDAVLIYSTQWIAVLDQLWQTRKRLSGVHVDENWHEEGDLEFDMTTDPELTQAIIARTPDVGVRSRPVDYDQFPVDSGTIVAASLLKLMPDTPLVMTSNNVYHDHATTEKLGALAAATAKDMGRRVAVVGVGGLSGSIIREEIDYEQDHIARPEDDRWNRRMLEVLESGDAAKVRDVLPQYAKEARADMGFKHLSWILGGIGDRYKGADTLAYGPVYGSGAAVVQFRI